MILIVVAAFIAIPLLSVVSVVLYQWIRLHRLRRRASITDLTRWLRTLLRRYAPGSVLVAEPSGRAGFLQFALSFRDQDQRVLEFGLPETEWSRPAIADIQRHLDAAGATCRTEAASEANFDRFFRAELRGDWDELEDRVSGLLPNLAAALGHPPHQTYRIQLLGREAAEYGHELADRLERIPRATILAKRISSAIRPRPKR